MFTSKHHLHDNLGVDFEIARFFVDRKVPAENFYWKGKYLYVAGGTGYLFIPLFFDLQYKCGVSLEQVLNEEYVQLMEHILHSAALHEAKEITFEEHVIKCKLILEDRVKNNLLFQDMVEYFKDPDLKKYKYLGTTSKALNRGDTFLFILCSLEIPERITNNILTQWYALVPSFLLMDDVMDLNDDQQKNEENAIADFGSGSEGVQKALEFLRIQFSLLQGINPKLGDYFESSLEKKLETPYLQSLLKR